MFMVLLFLLGAVSLLYLVKRIHWLLIEKDDELRYRSLKVGDDVMKNDASKATFEKGPERLLSEGSYQAPREPSIASCKSYENRNQMF